MASTSEKVSVYNLSDLKNTSDDAITNYLNSLKFQQSHFLGDVRLGLGYSAFAVAAACFTWDYKLGFDNTKVYTAVAVATYAILNGLLSFWMMFVEKGVVYQGTAPSGEQVTVVSAIKKQDPTYRLAITITDRSSKSRIFEASRPFASFFDESGYFVPAPFQEILATTVPIVGKQDPKRVRSESQDMLNANPELLDAVLAANSGLGSATATKAAEGGRRRKA